MNATRLYTLKYGQNKQVLSIGRVQTPTLALIVKRQQEIEHFVPKQYWELKTVYRDTVFSAIVRKSDEELAEEAEKEKENPSSKKKIQPDANRGIPQITDEQTGKELLERIRNVDFTVTEVSSKKGTEAPPRLFDLTSLQVECNKKFSYSADMTLHPSSGRLSPASSLKFGYWLVPNRISLRLETASWRALLLWFTAS